MKIWNKVRRFIQLEKTIIAGKIKKQQNLLVNEPIDFVVLWLDSEDKTWQEEKNRYDNLNDEANGIERYRNWDLFRFWFRAVEKNAPWVRKIHLVTAGHYPEWINANHEKINLVNHKDFIPYKYLPTFSTNPIELNLHRIEGLSNLFVYFNDDMFLNKPSKKEDFFSGNKPKYCNLGIPYKHYSKSVAFDHMLFNNIGLVNDYFDIKKCISRKPELWFNRNSKEAVKYHKLAFLDNYLYGMYFPHLGSAMQKSTMQKVWDVFGDELDKTCLRKFRSPLDVQQQIFHLWDIMNGDFVSVKKDYFGKIFEHIDSQLGEIEKSIKSENEMMICINDSDEISQDSFLELKDRVFDILEKKYPEKSRFEI